MGKINMGRVILGGLVAGIVINLFEGILNGVVLEKQWADVMTGLGKVGTMSVKQIVAFNAWGFAAGILLVWMYAAIRPRFGAGPKTAMCAGLFVWMLGCAMANSIPVFLHVFPVGLAVTATAVSLVEMLIAGVVGGYLYKEDSADAMRSSTARA
jgi:hypothetical protein